MTDYILFHKLCSKQTWIHLLIIKRIIMVSVKCYLAHTECLSNCDVFRQGCNSGDEEGIQRKGFLNLLCFFKCSFFHFFRRIASQTTTVRIICSAMRRMFAPSATIAASTSGTLLFPVASNRRRCVDPASKGEPKSLKKKLASRM